MKRFTFKLEAALRYRRRIEDVKKRELAEAQARVHRQQELIRTLDADRERGLDELAAMARGSLDMPALMAQRRYLLGVERRKSRVRGVLEGLAAPLEQARLALVDARKGVRVLERLRERRFEKHVKEESREEQRALDEIAITQHMRKEGK